MIDTPSPTWQYRYAEEQKYRRDDKRSAYQRDRARILHSAAFRRLQAKTQVLGAGMNDFYRTRLTHSLEASQIGTGIVAQLKIKQPEFKDLLPSTSLMESLCLAHDIGHPPFGHGGEIALHYMMRHHGGFEGNAQTFRIVTQLEPYTKQDGMNLSRRTLLGLIKYPALISQVSAEHIPGDVRSFRHLVASQWHPPKGIYDCDKTLFDWVLSPLSDHDRQQFATLRDQDNSAKHKKTAFKSLDCTIMELADDIAYGVHDLEDAVVMGIVTREQWQESVASQLADCGDAWVEKHIDLISQRFFGEHFERKDAIGALVNALITSISIEKTLEDQSFESPLLAWKATLTPEMAFVLDVLKQFVFKYVVQNHELQLFEYKGQQLVMELFEAIESDPARLLPDATRDRWLAAEKSPRIIADYISGMTDGFAQRLYSTLFDPGENKLWGYHQ
ncbi:anti-phage deoxyguanosine triphosphatase [Thaumasiovibrio subtropicus]|uniref:anti-phage deoxyguanosine triphosphatase n=1 Tax=Thaumasiovibrio subtropicus TaxID=1891207 RepID=UPI000B352B33|nr:anti-phage deoxyguanosine triphosphatase [Thaumasiovibrio subtropicus]